MCFCSLVLLQKRVMVMASSTSVNASMISVLNRYMVVQSAHVRGKLQFTASPLNFLLKQFMTCWTFEIGQGRNYIRKGWWRHLHTIWRHHCLCWIVVLLLPMSVMVSLILSYFATHWTFFSQSIAIHYAFHLSFNAGNINAISAYWGVRVQVLMVVHGLSGL